MQGLVYIFIGLAALGLGAAAYLGLSFTPIEALVTALSFGMLAIVALERQLRRRAEARLERGIEELSRLLATDANAGNVLSQRVNTIIDLDLERRIETIEADLSVFGTAVRQVAESVAEMEEHRRSAPDATVTDEAPAEEDGFPQPVIPANALRHALDDNRLVCHIEPIVSLPERKPHGYDIVPRLMLDNGHLADPPDYLPRVGEYELRSRVEAFSLAEAIVVARRSRTGRAPLPFYPPLSRATLTNPGAMERLIGALEANRAIAETLVFAISESEWRAVLPSERPAVADIARRGVGLSLTGARTLRFDFGDLEGLGFRSIRIDASRFIGKPDSFTDFHIADVADYVRRYGIELIATGVVGEQQLTTLYDAGILLAQGPVIGGPGPIRSDLTLERTGLARRRA